MPPGTIPAAASSRAPSMIGDLGTTSMTKIDPRLLSGPPGVAEQSEPGHVGGSARARVDRRLGGCRSLERVMLATAAATVVAISGVALQAPS